MDDNSLVIMESQRDEARRQAGTYRELLARIKNWGHLGDVPFWQQEIAKVLDKD